MTPHRIALLRTALAERELDALIVSSLPNIRYLTNFSGSHALVLVKARETMFLTDTRYILQSRQEVKRCKRIISRLDLPETVAAHNLLARCKRVGFESHHVTYAQYRKLKRLFPAMVFSPTTDMVEEIALVKEKDEIDAIQKVVDISDRVFHEILKSLRPGVRELEVAAEISYLHKRFGAESDAFETIIASGERGALPHARASSKRIMHGELVTLDFGCSLAGYNSDITRTVAVGKVSRQDRDMYNVVLSAQREAISSAAPGMWASDLDAVARDRIRKGGYGKYFTHSLGHGLGLHVHERPRISSLSKERLRAGSVITIEPGVYIPEVGGVRIEDDVVLTETGCRVLNTAPKDLMIL